MSRVAAWSGVPVDKADERVRSVANPFYERALKSTREKLESGAVSSEMLEKARNTLGIQEEDARTMGIETFDEEVRLQLGLPEEDDEGYDDDLDYDMNRRVATDEEGKELLYKLLNKREEATKEELKEMSIEDTKSIKFKEGAFEHVSTSYFMSS